MKRKWTRGEKWLWATPLIVLIAAGVAVWGPQVARKQLGLPERLLTTADSQVASIALSADGSTLAATTAESFAPKINGGQLYFWDARTLQPFRPWKSSAAFTINNPPAFRIENQGLILSPDAKSVGFARLDLMKTRKSTPYVFYNMKTGRARWKNNGFYLFPNALLSPDGSTIGLTSSVGKSAEYRFLRVSDGTLVKRWAVRDFAETESRFAWMPDGTSVICLGRKTPDSCYFEIRRLSDARILSA